MVRRGSPVRVRKRASDHPFWTIAAARGAGIIRDDRVRGIALERSGRERRVETDRADRLPLVHEADGQSRRRAGQAARGPRLRGEQGDDRAHRRAVRVEALLAVPGQAPRRSDLDHARRAAAAQDRGDPHSCGGADGDYDLVLIASPTWWIQTSMPIRSYLESPAARVILDGKPFATVSVSRRYFGFNLRQQQRLAEQNGGRFADKAHFVSAGGQVKSMLSWLGYMRHGEPKQRSLGLKLPPPNLRSDFEEQASTFADGLLDRVLQPVATANEGSST